MFDVGSAVGYLLLDTSKWESGLKAAKSGLKTFEDETSTTADKFAAVGTSLGSVGKTLTVGVTAPLVGLGAAAVKTAADFESSMSNLKAISGATTEEMSLLEEKAQEMGATTKFSASEAGEALTYMAMAGWETQDMLDGIGGVMSLAAASGEDLATTSDIVTDALTAFGLTAKDTQMFVDVLATAANSSNTNVAMLGESFKYAAPLAGTFGYSVQDIGAALGLMANSGIKASQAGTTLRSALSRMIKPTEQSATYMEKLGLYSDGTVTAMVNADGSMKSFRDTMVTLRTSFDQLTEAEQAQAASSIFGQESMAGMLAIINASDEDFNKLIGAMDNAAGTAESMADTQLDNLSGQLTILKSGVEGMAIAFGNLLLPMIKDVVDIVQNIVTWINGLSEDQQKLIVTIAEIAAAIGPVLLIVGKISTVISKVIGLISGAGGLSAVLTALTGPIGIVIAAVAALVAAWVTDFGGIRETVANVMESIQEIISSIMEKIQYIWENDLLGIRTTLETAFTLIETIFSDAFAIIEDVFKVFAALFSGDWEALWENIKQLLSDIWKAIKDIVSGALDLLVTTILGWVVDLVYAFNYVFDRARAAINEKWDSIVEWFKKAVEDPIGTILSIGESMYEAGKDILTSLWDGIKSVWGDVKNWFEEKVNWIADKVKFWDNESAKINSSPVYEGSRTSGSYSSGLDYVPRDMNVRVHEGERILTKQENLSQFNDSNRAFPEKLEFTFNSTLDGRVVAHELYTYNVREGVLEGDSLIKGGL